jgi:hypothetical protein
MNPGFEQKSGCPSKSGQVSLALYWASPNNGSPDYFNDCSPGYEYSTEFNRKGGQLPHEGHGYAGLQFYNMNRNEYYEYMEGRFDSALVAGQLYCISAYVSLGNVSYAFQELGAVLSVTKLNSDIPVKMNLPYTSLSNGSYLVDQDQWMCIKGVYKARGGETFVTIGDFSKGDSFWYTPAQSKTDSVFKSSYYFIDDISVTPVSNQAECNCPTKVN